MSRLRLIGVPYRYGKANPLNWAGEKFWTYNKKQLPIYGNMSSNSYNNSQQVGLLRKGTYDLDTIDGKCQVSLLGEDGKQNYKAGIPFSGHPHHSSSGSNKSGIMTKGAGLWYQSDTERTFESVSGIEKRNGNFTRITDNKAFAFHIRSTNSNQYMTTCHFHDSHGTNNQGNGDTHKNGHAHALSNIGSSKRVDAYSFNPFWFNVIGFSCNVYMESDGGVTSGIYPTTIAMVFQDSSNTSPMVAVPTVKMSGSLDLKQDKLQDESVKNDLSDHKNGVKTLSYIFSDDMRWQLAGGGFSNSKRQFIGFVIKWWFQGGGGGLTGQEGRVAMWNMKPIISYDRNDQQTIVGTWNNSKVALLTGPYNTDWSASHFPRYGSKRSFLTQ